MVRCWTDFPFACSSTMPSTILVVDDSRFSRQISLALVREMLGEQAVCLEAACGEDALAILAQKNVDLVLLDLTMPGLSGYDVLAEMRKRNLTVPVVVISADVQRLARERVIELGAIAFIAKPVSAEALGPILTTIGVRHG